MNQQKLPKNNILKNAAFFSGIAFRMIVIIGLGTFLGVKLDEQFPNEKNLYTIGLSFISVIVSILIVIRNVISASKKSLK